MSGSRSDMRSIAKGGGINAFSEGGKALLMMAILLVLARAVSKEEFGIFTLSQILGLMLIPVGGLGLSRATSRQIGYYKALGDNRAIRGVIRSAMQMWIVSSIAISIAYFALSAPLALWVFKDSGLLANFQMFSIYVGANIVSRQVGAIFRGFHDVRPKFYFVDIMPRVMALVLFIYLWRNDAPILAYSTAYAACFTISAAVSVVYLLRKLSSRHVMSGPWVPMHGVMLALAIPLLIQEIMYVSNSRISVLLMGAYMDSTAVGAYTAAQKLAVRIPFIHQGMLFVFLPVLSGYMAKNNVEGMRKVYAKFTRWVVLMTLPGILLILFFPIQILDLLYGGKYNSSWSVFVVLTLANSWQPFLGPTGPTMIALGKVKALMVCAAIAAVLNVTLNIVLIPIYGGMGAAIATSAALGTYMIVTLVYIYRHGRIHPFSREYGRLMIYGPSLCFFEFLLLRNFIGIHTTAFLIGVPVFFATVWGTALLVGVVSESERTAVGRKIRRTLGMKRKDRPGGRRNDRTRDRRRRP